MAGIAISLEDFLLLTELINPVIDMDANPFSFIAGELTFPDAVAAQVAALMVPTDWRNVAAAAQLLRYAGGARYTKETAGVTVHLGALSIALPTDETSQAKLSAAYMMAQASNLFTTVWKGSDGHFTSLNASQVMAMAAAAGGYVAACYLVESQMAAGITATTPTITTTSQIDAAFAAISATLTPPA